MAKKLFIVNDRMLQLWSYAVKEAIVADDDSWCKKIGFVRGNASNVRTGHQGFTLKQVQAAAFVTGANLNWIFGFENNMFREKKKLSSLQLLKQAVTAIEKEYK